MIKPYQLKISSLGKAFFQNNKIFNTKVNFILKLHRLVSINHREEKDLRYRF